MGFGILIWLVICFFAWIFGSAKWDDNSPTPEGHTLHVRLIPFYLIFFGPIIFFGWQIL